jgi:hypothetical protein
VPTNARTTIANGALEAHPRGHVVQPPDDRLDLGDRVGGSPSGRAGLALLDRSLRLYRWDGCHLGFPFAN